MDVKTAEDDSEVIVRGVRLPNARPGIGLAQIKVPLRTRVVTDYRLRRRFSERHTQ